MWLSRGEAQDAAMEVGKSQGLGVSFHRVDLAEGGQDESLEWRASVHTSGMDFGAGGGWQWLCWGA